MDQKIKKLGVNSTVVLTSLSLVACGGGGSDGYYNQNTGSNSNSGSGSNVDTSTKEATGVTLTLSKNELNVNGDEVTVTAKAVDKDGGGVAGKTIVLNIADHTTAGASSDSSEKTTDESGNVTFTVTLDGSNKSLEEIIFTATIKDTTINNVRKVSVTGAGTVVQSQYELVFDTVEHLPVSGGETVVRVRALDTNGGGVPNENVTLTVKDFMTNGVTIKGASNAVTDNEGYTAFTIVLPEGKEADREALITSGISLEATLTEESGATKTQVSTVIVDSVKSVVSSLSVTTSNNNKVDAIGGSIDVVVKAINPEGYAVTNKEVTLALDDLALEYGAELVNKTAVTNASGEATFTIKTEANSANPSGQLLVTNGITVTASLSEEGSAVQTSKITVVSTPAEEVSYLNTIVSDQIEISGGQATVTVIAKDKNGGSVANKQITLSVPNSQSNGLTITNGSKVTTDSNGQATFTLSFNQANVSESTIEALLKDGVTVSAAYATVASTTITQTTKVVFYKEQTVEQAKEVQRLELTASKGVVSSTNDTVQIKVRAVDVSGEFATNKSVTIGLTEAATSNGVTLDGAATKTTDSSGYVTYTLKVNAYNTDAIESLVTSGIAVAVSSTLSDGSTVKQNMQIMVEAVTLDAVDVSYLTISANQMINVDKGQTEITVSAVDSNGGILVGENITLHVANAQQNGLRLIGGSSAKTDEQGNATFTLSYDGSITDQELLDELKTQGVLLTATYQPTNANGTAITQTTKVRYYEQTTDVDVKQVNIKLSKGVAVAGNDSVTVTVQAVDENGQAVNGRKLSLALADEAKNNGATITGGSSKTTANNGEATFTVKLAAPNTDAINVLVASGLLVTASAEQNDGSLLSQTAKVMVVPSVSSSVDVAYLAIDALSAIDVDQNAEREVLVKAYNSSGSIVANKDIELNFGSAAGISIKEGSKLTTNASGEVKFTLVYNATTANKAQLLEDGLAVSVKYGSVTQTITAAFYQQAANIQRMDLVVDQAALVVNTAESKTVKATAILKDAQGNAVANRQVTLAINNAALQNGVSINGATGGSTVVTTNANGQVVVDLTVSPTTQAAVNALVASGIGIGVSALQGDGSSTIVQNTTVNILSEAALNEVGYLTTESSSTIATTGGTSTITVKAFNSNGTAIANKDIKLKLNSVPTGLNISVDAASKITAANGETQFTVTYTAPSNLTAEQIQALLAGIQATATYTTSAGTNINQSTVVQFYVDQVNIQRMDLVVDQAALVVNTTDSHEIKTTVTLKDNQSNPVVNRQVTLSIDDLGVDNNILATVVSFKDVIGGSTVVTTNANGQAEVTLNVKTDSKEAVDALVASGIGITASAMQGDGSGSIAQTTRINVVSAVSLAEVSYLTTDVSDTIVTTGGTSTITVKAFNSDGKPIANKDIKLNLAAIPTGLNIKVDATSKATTANGEAKFTVTYTKPATQTLTEAQVNALLAGIQATAVYTSEAGQNVTQTTIVQFNLDADEVAKDASRIDLTASKGSVVADNDTFTFTAKVFDKNGNPLVGKKVGIGLNTAATENGVTVSTNSVITDEKGEAVFTITVKATDDQKIENLIANGITLAASVIQSDGSTLSQNTQVMVNAPASKNVKELQVVIADEEQTVSVLGGKSIVGIKAVDSDGKTLTNKEVNFALSANVSSRVSVDKTTAITDSEGFAYFTVTVANGDIEDVLLEKGITFAVTTYNQGSTKPINQIGKINVTAPVEATNLTVSTSKDALLASGDSAEVYAKLVDIDGKAISGYPVTLTVKDSTLNGVTIAGAEKGSAITDASGNTKFKIDLAKITGKQYEELLKNGVDVIASITLANGVVRTETVHFDVSEAVSPYALTINASKDWLSVDGDKAIITVAATNIADGSAAANQKITLKVKKTNSTTGASVGIVNEDEGDNGIIDIYTVTSDQNGNGFFTLLIPVGVIQDGKDALIASGIELETTLNDEATSDVTTSQVYRLSVNDPTNITTRYSLRMASAKSILNVRNDVTDVTVTLLDQNGGGVADKYITLSIQDFINNGATIVGASGKTTDENGQATFTVRVDETARHQSYSAAQFTTDDLNLTASFSTAQVISTPNVASNIFRIDVAQVSVDEQPEGHLTFGRSALLEKSEDGNYYTESMSAQLVDKDGNAIANRSVTMNIDLLGIKKGLYSPTKDADGNPTRAKTTTVECFGSDLPARAQIATAFVSPSGGTSDIVTYTTDDSGKFDFRVRYLRQYAGWQDVNLTANVTINGNPVQNLESRLYYSLSMLKDDFDSEAGQPFDTSPYGTNGTCD